MQCSTGTRTMRLLALAWLACVAAAAPQEPLEPLELLILHNNDMHARFEQTSKVSGTCQSKAKCYGGFARVAHVVRAARADADAGTGPPVLFLNAGDTYTGTSWFGVFKWKIVAEFLNLLKPDAASLGNHEFDKGISGLVPLLNSVNFPIVTCNINTTKESRLRDTPIKKSVVLTVKGRKIGIIGYLTPDTKLLSNAAHVEFFEEVESIRKESEKLHAEGIKTIFALGHSGFLMDKMIAEKVPLVDAVIGGHTNTFLWNGPDPNLEKAEGPYPVVITQPSGKKVPVVQAYAYTKYMGRLLVKINSEGKIVSFEGQPQLLDSSVQQDDDVLKTLDKYRPEIDALAMKVIGKSKVFLDGDTLACRTRECNLGNLIADSMIAFISSRYEGMYWTNTPIAVVNGGAIRNSISASEKEGNVTQSDLLSVLPFDNRLYLVDLLGSDLKEMLEWSVHSKGETSRGEFLQVSGLQVLYDLDKPVGSRVVEVKTRCGMCTVPSYEKMNPDDTYRIAVFNFMVDGGDGYTIFKKGKNKVLEETSDLDIVSWYLRHQQLAIYPGVENRLQFVNNKYLTSPTPNSSGTLVQANLILLVVCVLNRLVSACR